MKLFLCTVLMALTAVGCETLMSPETGESIQAVVESPEAQAVAASVDTALGLFGLPPMASKTLEGIGALVLLLYSGQRGKRAIIDPVIKKLKNSEKGKIL